VALIRCIAAIDAVKAANDDEIIGIGIVKRAVESPLRSLAANAGVEGSVIVEAVKKSKGNEGYNVATGEYEDLVKAGIVDPRKSPAVRCRTRRPSPACSSPPSASSPTFLKRTSRPPAAAVMAAATWAAWAATKP